MSAPVLVRPREAHDLDACVQILARAHADDGYPQRWPDDPVVWLAPAHQLGAWVAVAGGDVVGHVALAPMNEPAPEPFLDATGRPVSGLGNVTRLCVDKDARGTGAASALLRAAVTAGRDRGLHAVLDVFSRSQGAIRFYEREGWSRVGSGYAQWRRADGERAFVHYYVAP